MDGNTSGAVKQVENISNAYQDATKEAEKLADAQSKIGQKTNISLGDSSTTSANAEIKANSEVIASIEKKKQELASYEFKLEETRYEIEKLSKAENEAYGFKKAYSNMNDKYINSRKESLYNSIFGTDKSKGQGSMKYQTMNFGGNVEKGYAAWREELERLGYTLSELRKTNIGVEADIIPIDGRAITNAEEFRKVLFGITSVPSDNIKVLNQQISELESKISSLKSEISSLESVSNNPKKDAFPDKDISASVESATNSIKEENNVLEQNTQKVKENTQAKGQNANVNLNKYDKRLDSYNGKVDKYQATIARFNDGGWTSDTYLKNVQAVKNAVNEYETLLKELKGKDASLVTSEDINKLDDYEKKIKDTIATVTNMSASEKGYNFVSAQKELDKIHKLLNENSNMSAEAKAKIKSYYAEIESGNPSMSLDRIHGEIMKIYNAEVEAGRAGKSFFDTLKNSGFHQIAAQMAGMFGVYDVINVVRQGVNTVRELDEAMTEVRKVSNATETQYTSFRDTISSTAKEIATTNKELLNSSADFLRLGYSLDQASDLAKNATLFVNVGDGVDITEATEDMITAMKAFDIQAKDSIKIVDDYNQIGNQFALSASDIGEAMKRSASALETGNNSFEQSIGLITAMNEIVQNSENTGNSLKVLSLRLRGAKAELEDMQEDTDGLCDSTSKLREQIMSLTGVDIMLDDNTFKSTTDIIKELGAVWDKLSDSSQAATLELIAGKSRANNIAALLKNYQRIDEVMESLGDAEGSAMRENEAIVDSINGRIKVLSATAEEFWKSFIDTDLVKNTVSLLSDMLNILTQIIDKGGALATLGIGGTGVGIGAFIKNFSWLTKSYKTRQSFLVG